ncbi:MAG: hypothetical protein IJQ81_12115, partial [Oscillibacter sp.]|nr:hypothetical protein [Oscillibacter sp.]
DLASADERTFGNGRHIRNIFDAARRNQAHRLTRIANPSKEQLSTLEASDFLPDEPTERGYISL